MRPYWSSLGVPVFVNAVYHHTACWYAHGYDARTGDGANVGPYRWLWTARIVCRWFNLIGRRP